MPRFSSALLLLVTLLFTLSSGNGNFALAFGSLEPQPNLQQFMSEVQFPFQNQTQTFVQEYDGTSTGAFHSTYNAGLTESIQCVSFLVAPCDLENRKSTDDKYTVGNAYGTECRSTRDFFCVEAITLTSQGKSRKLRKFDEIQIPAGSFIGDKENGVPSSEYLETIWSDPLSSNFYATRMFLGFGFDVDGNLVPASTTTPFKLDIKRVLPRQDAAQINPLFATSPCLYQSDSRCWVDAAHDLDTVLKAEVRLPIKLTGWFFGRLMNTSMQARAEQTYFKYEIQGDPVAVPVFYKYTPKTLCLPNWCPDRLIIGAVLGVNWEKSVANGYTFDSVSRKFDYLPPPTSSTPWQAFVQMSQDTATHIKSQWSISFSNSLTNIDYGTKCPASKSGINGVVTSNAMIYSSYGPTIKDSSFFYRVAGLHYLPASRKVAQGTYELQVDSALARCIFGLTKAPISASLSVLSSEGEYSVAVGKANEKNNMLRVSMKGFTFSMPTLRVKITQSKKILSIYCVSKTNPNLVRKITAISPKCGANYKQTKPK